MVSDVAVSLRLGVCVQDSSCISPSGTLCSSLCQPDGMTVLCAHTLAHPFVLWTSPNAARGRERRRSCCFSLFRALWSRCHVLWWLMLRFCADVRARSPALGFLYVLSAVTNVPQTWRHNGTSIFIHSSGTNLLLLGSAWMSFKFLVCCFQLKEMCWTKLCVPRDHCWPKFTGTEKARGLRITEVFLNSLHDSCSSFPTDTVWTCILSGRLHWRRSFIRQKQTERMTQGSALTLLYKQQTYESMQQFEAAVVQLRLLVWLGEPSQVRHVSKTLFLVRDAFVEL